MVTSVLAFFPHSAIEYLQDVSGVGGLRNLNITCKFASSIDIELQCSVDLAGPTAMTVIIPKETSSATAVMMVSCKVVYIYNLFMRCTLCLHYIIFYNVLFCMCDLMSSGCSKVSFCM